MALWLLIALALALLAAWLAIGIADDVGYDRRGEHLRWIANADRAVGVIAVLLGIVFCTLTAARG